MLFDVWCKVLDGSDESDVAVYDEAGNQPLAAVRAAEMSFWCRCVFYGLDFESLGESDQSHEFLMRDCAS